MSLRRLGINGLIGYCVGFLSAVALIAGLFFTSRFAQAGDSYACIRQDLDARSMSGNIPDPAFLIYY